MFLKYPYKGALMYFIPRNNKIYHYLAYTKPIKRYGITVAFLVAAVMINASMYYMLQQYVVMLEQELTILSRNSTEYKNKSRANKSLIEQHEQLKKDLAGIMDDKKVKSDFFTFLLNSISLHGLHLNTYTVQEGKKASAGKEKASLHVSGQLQNIIGWLTEIKESCQMIESSSWTLTYDGTRYTWAGDMCCLKKSLQLDQAEGLGG